MSDVGTNFAPDKAHGTVAYEVQYTAEQTDDGQEVLVSLLHVKFKDFVADQAGRTGALPNSTCRHSANSLLTDPPVCN